MQVNSDDSGKTLNQARILLDRLERISADSQWAHQASGIRASLAKRINLENHEGNVFQQLMEQGYWILEKAAAEFPED